MSPEKKVAIVMPARNEWSITESGGLLEKVLRETPKDFEPKIFVCANNSDPEFVKLLKELNTQEGRVQIIDLGNTKPLGWAYAYLYGMRRAINDSAQYIVEMDANGSHDPVYIPEFLHKLDKENAGAVFSTRFSKSAHIEKYPLQRQLVSRSGTIAANIMLGLGQWVDDMTSGYEAFRKEVLGDILSAQPLGKWISVEKGPGHFYQTEMRAMVLWRKHNVNMLPIVWGANRNVEPELLPLRTILHAFKDLIELRSRRKDLLLR